MSLLGQFRNFKDAGISFRYFLSNGYSIDYISHEFGILPENVINILLRFNSYDSVIDSALKKYYSKNMIDDNRVLVISDTHIGSCNDSLNNICAAYNYCNRSGIRNVILNGDIINGNNISLEKKYNTSRQIKNLRNTLKQIKQINTYYIYGDCENNLELYDLVSLRKETSDIDNFKYIGNGFSFFKLNDDDFISLYHENGNGNLLVPTINTDIRLEGHHHNYEIHDEKTIYLPALLDNNSNPGFIEIESINNGYLVTQFGFYNLKPIVKSEKIIKKSLN